MTTSADGGAGGPREGYYPDPSIPGYVRYWDGTAWVPGTSRPEPGPGEELPPPPGRPAAPRRLPAEPSAPEVSGAMFFDEDPAAPVAQQGPPTGPTPAARPPAARPPAARPPAARPPAAQVPAQPHAAATEPGWNAGPAGDAQDGPGGTAPHEVAPAGSTAAAPHESGYGYPRTAPPATPAGDGSHGYPERDLPSAPGGYGYPPPAAQGPTPAPGPTPAAPAPAGVPWQRQVSELARQDGPAAPGGPEVVPWRPLASDPFASAGQLARPGGLGRRFAARLVDTLLVGAVVSGATYPLAIGSLHHLQHKIDAARLSGENVQVWLIDGTTGLYLGAVVAGLLLAGLLYEVLPTVKWGRTLGKRLFRLQVLDIDSQMAPGFGTALRRMLVRQVLDLVVVGLGNVFWCVVDRPWRQCWHDKAARTFVAHDEG